MWYYVLDGEKHGPVSEEEIHDLIHDGYLDSESYIWTAEMNDWKSISEVEQFLPKPPPIPSDAIDAAKQGERNSPDEISTDHQSQEKNQYTYASFANRAVALVLDIGFRGAPEKLDWWVD
jgi:hypothetical protein